jgi:flagellar biosynthesis protein FlhG
VRLQTDQASSLRSGDQAIRRSGAQAEPTGPGEASPDFAGPERLNARTPDRLIPPLLAIVSGKGGVGKTFLAINLALALRGLGHRPFLVDLDWGLANIDVALGLAPPHHVGHVLAGECSLEEALIEHEGLVILPNGCGQADLAGLGGTERRSLLEAVLTARADRDFVVADTHPGIGAVPIDVARRATATIIVSTPEPTALTDTYALFKVLGETPTRGPVGLVVNQAGSTDQAYETARHLDSVARRFLGRGIAYWGHVLQDAAVPRSVRQQRALLAAAPRSAAAHSIRQVAATVAAIIDAERRNPQAAPGSIPGGQA